MFYVICGLDGFFYVLPAEGIYHCRLQQIESGPHSSEQAAHARLKGIEVEFMLGETGVDYCLGCSRPMGECMCAEIEKVGRQYQDYLDGCDGDDPTLPWQ